MFMLANSIISTTEGIEIKGLLEGMVIPKNIQEAINAVPGGTGAKVAEIRYKRNAVAQAESNNKEPKKPRIEKFGAKKRRSNRRKVQLAPTLKRVVKRRSLKKKCHA